MLYACIECRKIWSTVEDLEQLDLSRVDLDNCPDISHGICPECFQRHEAKVHKHQKNSGYTECYNRHDNCPNYECLFRPACGDSAINTWKSSIVVLNAGK